MKPKDRALASRIAFELGFLYLSQDERAAAEATLLWAQDENEARPSADVVHLRALIADAVGDYRQARDAYRTAISHSSRALTRVTRVLALANLAVSLNHVEPQESVSLCGLALTTLEAEQLHPQIRPSVRNVLGYALVCLGQLEEARAAASAARDEAREMDQQLVALYASFNLAVVDELQGNTKDADARLVEVAAAAAASNLAALDGWTVIRRAWLRLCDDDPVDARRLLADRFGARVPQMHADSLRMLRALLDLHDRRYVVARRTLLELVRVYHEKDDELDRFAVLLWLATLDRESGREDWRAEMRMRRVLSDGRTASALRRTSGPGACGNGARVRDRRERGLRVRADHAARGRKGEAEARRCDPAGRNHHDRRPADVRGRLAPGRDRATTAAAPVQHAARRVSVGRRPRSAHGSALARQRRRPRDPESVRGRQRPSSPARRCPRRHGAGQGSAVRSAAR